MHKHTRKPGTQTRAPKDRRLCKALKNRQSTVLPLVLCNLQFGALRAEESENLRPEEEVRVGVEGINTRKGAAAISGKSGARHWMCWLPSACAGDRCSRIS